METLTLHKKDEATGEFIPFPFETNLSDDYLAYEGGEVWFAWENVKVGKVEGADYYGYQWTCYYTNLRDALGEPEQGAYTCLSRKYASYEEARTACLNDLSDKSRYEDILNFLTNGEQTLEQLGLFLDAE